MRICQETKPLRLRNKRNFFWGVDQNDQNIQKQWIITASWVLAGMIKNIWRRKTITISEVFTRRILFTAYRNFNEFVFYDRLKLAKNGPRMGIFFFFFSSFRPSHVSTFKYSLLVTDQWNYLHSFLSLNTSLRFWIYFEM